MRPPWCATIQRVAVLARPRRPRRVARAGFGNPRKRRRARRQGMLGRSAFGEVSRAAERSRRPSRTRRRPRVSDRSSRRRSAQSTDAAPNRPHREVMRRSNTTDARSRPSSGSRRPTECSPARARRQRRGRGPRSVEVGHGGRLVGRADPGQSGERAATRPRVEALDVAAGALLQARVDEHFDEPQALRLMQLSRARAVVRVRGDQARDRTAPASAKSTRARRRGARFGAVVAR